MSLRSIVRLMELLKIQSQVEQAPGFSSTLGLTLERISLIKDRVSFDKATQTLHVSKWTWPNDTLADVSIDTTRSQEGQGNDTASGKLTSRQSSSTSNTMVSSPKTWLSTYAALTDDVTTWALMLADPKRGRPGVSVSLRAAAGPALCDLSLNTRSDNVQPILQSTPTSLQSTSAASQSYPDLSLDITATVRKIGQNLGYCTAEIRAHSDNASNNDNSHDSLICTVSHVKYMNSMGKMADFLTSSTGWPLLVKYAPYYRQIQTLGKNQSVPPGLPYDFNNIKSMQDLLDSLTFIDDNTASIVVSPHHASLGGPIHGGMQFVIMERVASVVAERYFMQNKQGTAALSSLVSDASPANQAGPHEIEDGHVMMDSVTVEYLSPPPTAGQTALIHVQTYPTLHSHSILLQVQLKTQKDRICSLAYYQASKLSSKATKTHLVHGPQSRL
jgi:hypothetical protein